MDPTVSPGPDTSFASRYLIPCGVLAGLALGLCVTRIYTRSRPIFHLALDDYLIIVAEVRLICEVVEMIADNSRYSPSPATVSPAQLPPMDGVTSPSTSPPRIKRLLSSASLRWN